VKVPSARQVFGPARANTLADWWEADQIGKPITASQAHWLRRRKSPPPGITKALARRGLYLPPDMNDPKAERWSPEAQELRRLLGMVPTRYWPWTTKAGTQAAPSEDRVTCPTCGKSVSVELVAWGAGERCLACEVGA